MAVNKATNKKSTVSTGYLLNFIANDWQKKINELFSKYSIDYLQYALLNALENHHANQIIANQVMLSNFAGIDKMTTSKTMRKLEQQKFLKRKESKVDSRAKTVEITDKGKKIHEQTTKVLEKFEADFFENILKKDKLFAQKLAQMI